MNIFPSISLVSLKKEEIIIKLMPDINSRGYSFEKIQKSWPVPS